MQGIGIRFRAQGFICRGSQDTGLRVLLPRRQLGAHISGSRVATSRTINLRSKTSSMKTTILRASEKEEASISELPGITAGLLANPVVVWSLWVLKNTGCGLPPGPGGLLGALEGISYLTVLGIVGWSATTKIRTGTGLPNGPFGLLGAVEGLSYLSVLAIVAVFGLQFIDYGFIPAPLPSAQCFG